jgi:hypothetical protein
MAKVYQLHTRKGGQLPFPRVAAAATNQTLQQWLAQTLRNSPGPRPQLKPLQARVPTCKNRRKPKRGTKLVHHLIRAVDAQREREREIAESWTAPSPPGGRRGTLAQGVAKWGKTRVRENAREYSISRPRPQHIGPDKGSEGGNKQKNQARGAASRALAGNCFLSSLSLLPPIPGAAR